MTIVAMNQRRRTPLRVTRVVASLLRAFSLFIILGFSISATACSSPVKQYSAVYVCTVCHPTTQRTPTTAQPTPRTPTTAQPTPRTPTTAQPTPRNATTTQRHVLTRSFHPASRSFVWYTLYVRATHQDVIYTRGRLTVDAGMSWVTMNSAPLSGDVEGLDIAVADDSSGVPEDTSVSLSSVESLAYDDITTIRSTVSIEVDDLDLTTTSNDNTTNNDTTNTTQPNNDTTNTTQPNNNTTYTTQPNNNTTYTTQPSNNTTYTTQPNNTTYTSQPGNDTGYTSQPGDDTGYTSQPGDDTGYTSQPSDDST